MNIIVNMYSNIHIMYVYYSNLLNLIMFLEYIMYVLNQHSLKSNSSHWAFDHLVKHLRHHPHLIHRSSNSSSISVEQIFHQQQVATVKVSRFFTVFRWGLQQSLAVEDYNTKEKIFKLDILINKMFLSPIIF